MPFIPPALLAALLLAAAALPATAQSQRQSHCIALADAAPGFEYLRLAAFGTALPEHSVRISYAHHASFVIETAEGVTAATDYTGYLGWGDIVPDLVTMNNAHSTHWTHAPDPRIAHVLHGWAKEGVPAQHHLVVGDLLVRNVPTDVRDPFGERRKDGNSIFVFEAAGLCIGHLGHLHHEPSPAQYAALGRLDVVMAPVDGGFTMAQEAMVRVLRELRTVLILPMHWFGESNLQRFLAAMRAEGFAVVEPGGNALEVSVRTLPQVPVVHLLRPQPLRPPG
ncbi:MAG: Zn-dependent hydrolase [Alphaproteobacteria bacterium HGW-Alphaproteobacteria-2]|nr:MAG: Zn-dependent hydrolase [Alphaproteobacteria bacterium HGW-Alphaproteobacteria-2]